MCTYIYNVFANGFAQTRQGTLSTQVFSELWLTSRTSMILAWFTIQQSFIFFISRCLDRIPQFCMHQCAEWIVRCETIPMVVLVRRDLMVWNPLFFYGYARNWRSTIQHSRPHDFYSPHNFVLAPLKRGPTSISWMANPDVGAGCSSNWPCPCHSNPHTRKEDSGIDVLTRE